MHNPNAVKAPPAQVTLRYAGASVEEGAIDVRDLSPALLSFADLLQRSASVALGPEVVVRTKIRSGLRKGSVIANFDLYLEGAIQLAAFATSTYGSQLPALLQAIGIHKAPGTSLLKLLKWLRGREEREVIKQDSGNIAIVVDGNNNTIVVAPEVYDLYRDADIRRAAYGVARPLEQPGIDSLQFKEGRRVAERISVQDAKALQAAVRPVQPPPKLPPAEQIESEEMLTVDLLQGVFSEGESFRFYDGETKFWARISDASWWAAIHNRTDGYYEGDRMRVRMVIRQGVDTKGNLTKEREIVEVLWHEHRPRQTDLFAPSQDE